jgi:transketolase
MNKCKKIRKKIIDIISSSGAAHIASSLSCVEILVSIYDTINTKKIKDNFLNRDRVLLSKGHATAALYATLSEYNLLSEKNLKTYSKDDSILSGHPNHVIRNVEHSTGALGHGLPVGVGMCLGSKSLKIKNKVYVVLGDGELHEGSNWEALMFAGHHQLKNLVIFVDNNGQSQIGKTDKAVSLRNLKAKIKAFDFSVKEANGHNLIQLKKILNKNKKSKKPLAIICNTTKGKGVSFMEKNNLWHYKAPRGDDYKNSINELTKRSR